MTAPATILAIDVGGTKIEAALVNEAGQIAEATRSRAATGRAMTVRQFDEALRSVIARAVAGRADAVAGVGIGAAGPVDLQRGTIAPLNLPLLNGFPIRERVRALIAADCPIEMALDGTCITLAEHRFGSLIGVDNAVALTVSTGIGGGLILHGELISGATGNAGHIGQMYLRDPAGSTPEDATLEGIASGTGAVRWARTQGWPGENGEDLARGAKSGDPIAAAAIERSARAVGQAISALGAALDIERAAIGGGFSYAAPDYVARVQAIARSLAILPAGAAVTVVPALLGGEAPLVGAAALALHARTRRPSLTC
ncbi:ROK family protein [Microbacterium sp. HJ5]